MSMKPTDLFNEGSYDVTLNVERRKAKRSKSFSWKVLAGTLWTLNIQIVLAPLEWSSKEAARAGEFFLAVSNRISAANRREEL